jgi:lysophospholipase L1-like esterase
VNLVRRSWTVATVTIAAVLVVAGPAAADPNPLPTSMASMGDSITRGFNACGWYVDCPSRSFSTGDSTAVYSHYRRILAKDSAIYGQNFNVSSRGAKADDMFRQANLAGDHSAQYVTMLIGANDACTSSESSMTSVDAYRANVRAGLNQLKARLPNAKVRVVSIPNIRRLWEIGKDNFFARTAWSTFRVCQSMLANPRSDSTADGDRRQRVYDRVVAFNWQLKRACDRYGPNCSFDNNSVFNIQFTLSQVSGWDYFHPNTSGQSTLADASYP